MSVPARALVAPSRDERRTLDPPEPTAYPPELLEPQTLQAPPRRRRRGGRGPSGLDPRPGLIPGLDGLRAIAVAAVLVYHLVPGALPGGFLGVDVFFVVSGFLITTLLARELADHGRLDLPSFWRRRARRLVPPLLIVVLVSVTAARFVGGDLLVGIGRQTVGALTFTTNWLELAAGASYFASTSPILFVNFWSLAVEEQFYLLWPLTLVLALALTRTTRQRVLAVAGIGVASAVAMAVLADPGGDSTRAYYGTDTHLMGLMGGAALALAWADPGNRAGLRTPLWRRWRGYAVLGALAVLLAQMRWMGEDSPLTFRGGILLASLATVVLVAGLLEADGPWRRLMQLAPLRWLGERSYGIYLWHWPVIVILAAVFPYAPGTATAAVVITSALLLTLTLAELSFRLVERPVRRRGMRRSVRALASWFTTPWRVSRGPRIVAGILALMLVATVVAVLTAPEKSATQEQIEATEARLAQGGADPGTGAPEGTGSTAGVQAGALGAGLGLTTGEAAAAEGTAGEAGAQDEAVAPPVDEAEGAGEDTAEDEAAAEEEADGDGAAEGDGTAYTEDEQGLLVPAGEEITAIGDSLVVTSADGLTYRFPGIGYIAKSNRQWPDAAGLIEAGLADGTIRDNVVLHYGTNAGVDEAALRGALEALGPERRVVVMNLYVQASFTESSNATIEQVVADFPHAVVGDWAGTVSAQPQVLQSDRVHPDLEGMHVYAEVVARAFDELARRDA
ncbi:acyltransferase family protein [Ornithinimicrobium cerasi]|uniref:acyltransferase family protein n=1 Tax=Ornithinimicrobium cerasi TaxID=2248773 RepID=UPI001379AA5A|nr:acyltransferase family protein [Ornithinimicrobium cerasi]